MSHPLAHLIPGRNDINLIALANGGARAAALESAYSEDGGFVGCFDTHDEPWCKRIAGYDRDEFLYDTDGPHEFSEVFDGLPDFDDDNDGCHVYHNDAFTAWDRDGVHKDKDGPFSVYQNFGDCVDASNKEMKTGLLGIRAMDTQYGEILKYLAAFYQYAERGYCRHGWTMGACATRNKQFGWCPATVIEVGGQRLDFDEENESEYTVARDWCRSGIPDWLAAWTQQNFAWDPSAITYLDGGLDQLKRLLSNKGQFHHGSNTTSGSSRPNVFRRIGGHAQTCFGGDWSDRTRQFFADKGFRLDSDDFWVLNHQTWGSGWRGEIASQYWPEWWGKKPEGTWVVSAKGLLRRVSGYAYLPGLKGVPGSAPVPPPPDDDKIPGTVYAEELDDGNIAVRGMLVVDGVEYIAYPLEGQTKMYEFKRPPRPW